MSKKDILLQIIMLTSVVGMFAFQVYFLDQKAKQARIVHNEFNAWQEKDENLRNLQTTYKNNKQAIDLINQALPGRENIIPFFENLESIASQSGVTVSINMKTQPEEDQVQNLITIFLTLTTKGTFSQTVDFISKLEKNDQLILVSQIILNSGKGLSDEINSQILIKTFFAK